MCISELEVRNFLTGKRLVACLRVHGDVDIATEAKTRRFYKEFALAAGVARPLGCTAENEPAR